MLHSQAMIPMVVEVHMTACRAFDTDYAYTSEATGFVGDKRRRIIVTNLHVVSPGIP